MTLEEADALIDERRKTNGAAAAEHLARILWEQIDDPDTGKLYEVKKL